MEVVLNLFCFFEVLDDLVSLDGVFFKKFLFVFSHIFKIGHFKFSFLVGLVEFLAKLILLDSFNYSLFLLCGDEVEESFVLRIGLDVVSYKTPH